MLSRSFQLQCLSSMNYISEPVIYFICSGSKIIALANACQLLAELVSILYAVSTIDHNHELIFLFVSTDRKLKYLRIWDAFFPANLQTACCIMPKMR